MFLLVDGDPGFLEAAEQLYRRRQPLLLASTANQTMMLLHSLGPDISVAMVNPNLPGNDGASLIQEIRAAFPNVPVVEISGVFRRDVLEAAKLFGPEAPRKPVLSEWESLLIALTGKTSA